MPGFARAADTTLGSEGDLIRQMLFASQSPRSKLHAPIVGLCRIVSGPRLSFENGYSILEVRSLHRLIAVVSYKKGKEESQPGGSVIQLQPFLPETTNRAIKNAKTVQLR